MLVLEGGGGSLVWSGLFFLEVCGRECGYDM